MSSIKCLDPLKINIIGLKKGEKIIEELFTEKETKKLIKTEIDNIFYLKNYEKCPKDINTIIMNFEKLLKSNASQKEFKNLFLKIFPSLKK